MSTQRFSLLPLLLHLPPFPPQLESLLCWPLALSLLSVSGYHYVRMLLAGRATRKFLTNSSSIGGDDSKWDDEESSGNVLPLTTLSFLERTVANTPCAQPSLLHRFQTLSDANLETISDVKETLQDSPFARKLFTMITTSNSSNNQSRRILNLLRRTYSQVITKPPLPPTLSPPMNNSGVGNPTVISVVVPCYGEVS